MDETLERLNSVIAALYGEIDNLKPGSEELQRLVDSIVKLEQARDERMKALAEEETKTEQTKINWINLGITAGGVILVPLIAIGVQRWTNVDLMNFERTDVMGHRGFDLNITRFLKK